MMAVARVVEFEGVSQERAQQMKQRMQGGEPLEGLRARRPVLPGGLRYRRSTGGSR